MNLSGYKLPAGAESYRPTFAYLERKYNLPVNLLTRIAWQESTYNPNASNPWSDAKGMFQLTPITLKELANNDLQVNPFNVSQAAEGAAFYLDLIRDRYGFGGNWQLILAGYNRGPVAVRAEHQKYLKTKKPMRLPRETVNYYTSIMRDLNLPYA